MGIGRADRIFKFSIEEPLVPEKVGVSGQRRFLEMGKRPVVTLERAIGQK
jgi:hypothetical protein